MLKNSRDKLNELYGYKKVPVPVDKKKEGVWEVAKKVLTSADVSKGTNYIAPLLLWAVFWFILYLNYESAWKFMWSKQGLFWSVQVVYLILVFGVKGKPVRDGGVTWPFYQKWLGVAIFGLVAVAILSEVKVSIPFVGGNGTETSITTTKAPRVSPVKKQTVIEVVAVRGVFTEVSIPPRTAFRWNIREGCLVAVVHDGIPQGAIRDCAEHIELGNIRNIRLGFSSKTEVPITIRVTLTPL